MAGKFDRDDIKAIGVIHLFCTTLIDYTLDALGRHEIKPEQRRPRAASQSFVRKAEIVVGLRAGPDEEKE